MSGSRRAATRGRSAASRSSLEGSEGRARGARRDPASSSRCAVCGKAKKPPKGKGYAKPGEIMADPFCTRKCCEEWWGVVPAATGGYGITYGQGRKHPQV